MRFLIECLYKKHSGVDIFWEIRRELYSWATSECNYPIYGEEEFFRYLDAVDDEGRYIRENDVTHVVPSKR